MDRITSIVPTPTPVTLAGRAFPVWEARLRDLASLQAWVDSTRPDPSDGLFGPEGEGDEARDRRLFGAYFSAESSPTWDSPEGQALLATPEGSAAFLKVALVRGTPSLSGEDVQGVQAGATGQEFARLRRAFFGVDVRSAAAALLGVPAEGPKGRTLTWAEAVAGLAEEYGWAPETVYDLTVREFRAYRRKGKAAPEGFQGPPEVLERLRERMIRCGFADG